ncbi:chorismate lyase [Spongiibacter nanhainus]|uniref:Probable chorismate pyruvate-lyase n=1 Tax=Spongiibacter nanhainus TaxID=2794344 RepID=A0A7T4URD5_9GAMM|nr:chorismate lyase [Spongiibacter nanhainus]QQD18245.1 chorismate lyase [Spongiibacter nanhainus]
MYAFAANSRQTREPRWRSASQFVLDTPPPGVAGWLLDRGSLTAHLRRVSGGQFHVQVLRQRWGLPQLSERQLLGMGDREWGLIREVLLCCHGEPWVYARSVLPAKSLCGRLRRLRRLDNRPLGHLLFSEPSMERIPYQIARFGADQLPLQGLDSSAQMWGRRSCFLLQGRPIMVSEIFLPSFQPW